MRRLSELCGWLLLFGWATGCTVDSGLLEGKPCGAEDTCSGGYTCVREPCQDHPGYLCKVCRQHPEQDGGLDGGPDADGASDAGDTGGDALSCESDPPPCKTLPECEDTDPACIDGAWVCTTGFEPSERSCDGLDNDCDGSTDVNLVCVLAGSGQPGFEDGSGEQASFDQPRGLVSHPQAGVVVADSGNHALRWVLADGSVITLAGTGSQGSDDGPALQAGFNQPSGVSLHPDGSLIIADRLNNRIRRLGKEPSEACLADTACLANSCAGRGSCDDTSGAVVCTCDPGSTGTHCADCATDYHPDGSGGCVADEACPGADPCGEHGSCDDSAGVIVCVCAGGYTGASCDQCTAGYHDEGGGICTLDTACGDNTCSQRGACEDSAGIVCTCEAGYAGAFCDGCDTGFHRSGSNECVQNEECPVTDPCGLHGSCNDASGVVMCICETGYFGPSCDTCSPGLHPGTVDIDVVTTVAGSGFPDFLDGPAAEAHFALPSSVVVALDGAIYVADTENHCLRIVAEDQVSTFAGRCQHPGLKDGSADEARFNRPTDLLMLEDGSLVVSEESSHTLRGVASDGTVTTLAGTGNAGYTDGVPLQAEFWKPGGCVQDSDGILLLVADRGNHRVRAIEPATQVTTLLGAGQPGMDSGPPSEASFRFPSALAFLEDGRLVIADTQNHVLRVLQP